MGWADCGTDSEGRPIGYAHEATCDHPGCNEQIHRGLAYACGGMHGADDFSCERYFCADHRGWIRDAQGKYRSVCAECEKMWRQEFPEDAAKLDSG
jgi:hypothetical protein